MNPRYLDKVQAGPANAPNSSGLRPSTVISGQDHHGDGRISHLYQPELTPWRKSGVKDVSPRRRVGNNSAMEAPDAYLAKPDNLISEKDLQFRNSTAMRNRYKVNQPAPLAGSRAGFPFRKDSDGSPDRSPPVKYALGTNQEQVNIML